MFGPNRELVFDSIPFTVAPEDTGTDQLNLFFWGTEVGVKAAQSRLVLALDSDDEIFPELREKLVSAMSKAAELQNLRFELFANVLDPLAIDFVVDGEHPFDPQQFIDSVIRLINTPN